MLFLVVDDDGLSRELLTLLLAAEGHDVETAASGEEAVTRTASLLQATPDVLLTDVQMPGLAGDALARVLRDALGERRTLLLAMSGSRLRHATLTGFDGFLLKPFKVSELQSAILGTGRAAASRNISARQTANADAFDTELPEVRALDEDIYTRLRELMPEVQLGQMYALCVGDARKRIAHMRLLAADGDDARYRAEAHTVKGGSGMIGAKQIYEFAAAAERNGLRPDMAIAGTTSVTTALTQLSLACDRLERILVERTRE